MGDDESHSKYDDPFAHLLVPPSVVLNDNNHDIIVESDVIVEDASSDEEEEGDNVHDNGDDEKDEQLKRSYIVQEMFPASTEVVAVAGNRDEGEVPTSEDNASHSNAVDVELQDDDNNVATIQEGAPAVPHFDMKTNDITIEQLHNDGSLVDAAAALSPTETYNDHHYNHNQEEEVSLISFHDDEVVTTCHQGAPLQINEEHLLDIPLPSNDFTHPYHDFQSPDRSATDNEELPGTAVDLRNATDATITTMASTTVNQIEDDSLTTQEVIPSAYDNSIEGINNEIGDATRELEVNYGIDTKLIAESATNDNDELLENERNYLDGHKVSRNSKKKKKRIHRRRERVTPKRGIGFDEEQAIHPGSAAYDQLRNQDGDNEGTHRNNSQTKLSYKQRRHRRCILMLCIVVVALLAAIAGLLYYLIASPGEKITSGNGLDNNSGIEIDLGNVSSSDTAVNSSDMQDSAEGVHDDQHFPSQSPISTSQNETIVDGGDNSMMVGDSDHDLQDNSTEIGESFVNLQHPLEPNSTSAAMPDNNTNTQTTNISLLVSNSSSSPPSYNTPASPCAKITVQIQVIGVLGNSSEWVIVPALFKNESDLLVDDNIFLRGGPYGYVNETASNRHYTEACVPEGIYSLLIFPFLEVDVELSFINGRPPLSSGGKDVVHFEIASSDISTSPPSASLMTTNGIDLVNGISKSYGIVFDIESLVGSLTVTGTDLYLDTVFASRFEVWVNGSDGFVEIAHGSLIGTGVCHDIHLDTCTFAPIPTDAFNSVTIEGGEKRTFWVTLRDDDLVSHNRDAGEQNEIYATNGEMNVYYGSSILNYPIQLADPETDYRSGRGFIGRIRYKVTSSSDHADSEKEKTTQQPSLSPTDVTSSVLSDPVLDGCHYMTKEACSEAANSLGLQIGGAGFPFTGPYSRSGCHFYPCSSCVFGGIAYFGTEGTVSDFQSTESVHSEKRLDCNTRLFSIDDGSPFWCLFPTAKCAGC